MIDTACINGHEVTYNTETHEVKMFGDTYELSLTEEGFPKLRRYDEDTKFWVSVIYAGTKEETEKINGQLIEMLTAVYLERVEERLDGLIAARGRM